MSGQKRIVLGVSGSIAAYKALYLLRELTGRGYEVAPVLTQAATRFVGALSFSSLAGRRAVTDLWSSAESGEIGHVELAHWCDAVCIAPASADTLAKIAHGRSEDPLSALCLSSTAPLLVAPAMEDGMWKAVPTREHLATLKARGVRVVAPEAGALASGRSGEGRLADADLILEELESLLVEQDLAGEHLLITAGPTREHLDPARFLSNPSSGRMGFALARIAKRRGARVTLIAGPVHLETPPGVERIDVTSTEEMLTACKETLPGATGWFMAAAPADFAPATSSIHKLKKGEGTGALQWRLNPDILKTLAPAAGHCTVFGFAAETRDWESYGRKKLEEKKLAAIVVNDVGPGGAFGSSDNEVVVLTADGRREVLPRGSKESVASALLSTYLRQKA